jgi:tetratricopeptide (TPR) repeat protein
VPVGQQYIAERRTNEGAVIGFRADISRIIKYAPADLIGREAERQLLNEAWDKVVGDEKPRSHILTFVALGGEGKTSLVAKWAAELAHQNWPGCEAAFAWSFYSQGTSEKTQASSDSFLKEALVFFGDAEMANSAAGSFDKGRRLAQLIGERRALLILDGLEPLQYAPTSPTGSELKDQGVSALLKALATKSDGLCVVTTRYSIPDLRNFWQNTAPEIKLTSLSREAGVALLRTLGVKGTQSEFEQLVTDVKGHALTLNLLGTFLRDAHARDIRKRDLVKLEEADAEEQSGHAFHVMDAYVESFKDEGEKGKRALSILRLLGLFDRPASADCLSALWTGEEIGGLTGSLIGLSESQRNITLKRLEDANLITVNRDSGPQELVSLDAHPLLREYFAKRLREELLGAWRAAHRRLYEYLRDNTHEGDQPTLEDLQPLYQAVAHGCQAGLYEDALFDIYRDRIAHGNDYYSISRLVFASDIGAIACFFDRPWSNVSRSLSQTDRARLLGIAAFNLSALGRLLEAIEPMRIGQKMHINETDWLQASISGDNVTNLELTLGHIKQAIEDAKLSLSYADKSNQEFQRMAAHATYGDALHQSGRRSESATAFREAEKMQVERQPEYSILYSLQGVYYCDLLLDGPVRAAWQTFLQLPNRSSNIEQAACREVFERASRMLEWAEQFPGASLLDFATNHLILGSSALYQVLIGTPRFSWNAGGRHQQNLNTDWKPSDEELEAAVNGLRRAGRQSYIPLGLLNRAWVRFLENNLGEARADLDEAWEIAERGPMRLHMADIHLYRARLFHAVKPYPWDKNPDGTERGPKDDLKDARTLIEKCGYWRRKEELEDAEEAAQNWK